MPHDFDAFYGGLNIDPTVFHCLDDALNKLIAFGMGGVRLRVSFAPNPEDFTLEDDGSYRARIPRMGDVMEKVAVFEKHHVPLDFRLHGTSSTDKKNIPMIRLQYRDFYVCFNASDIDDTRVVVDYILVAPEPRLELARNDWASRENGWMTKHGDLYDF